MFMTGGSAAADLSHLTGLISAAQPLISPRMRPRTRKSTPARLTPAQRTAAATAAQAIRAAFAQTRREGGRK